MDRLACVDLPALPLQLLLRRQPDWAGHPVAVVDKDSPQGRLLCVNERAHALRILPGQRYAAALSLSNELRADVVAREQIGEGIQELTARLHDFTPHVEPKGDEPGVFWLDAGGLGRLFQSASRWGRKLRDALEEEGFVCAVVVGFTRFGSYAVARASRGLTVFRTAREEEDAARDVPLDRLGFEPGLRDALEKLGVTTLGRFIELPAQGLRERFGEESWRLHRMASGRLWTPLDPVEEKEPLAVGAELDRPDADAGRLLFLVKRLCDPLLAELPERCSSVRGLHMGLVLDDGRRLDETVRPAEPTRDAAQLMDLVRLRLDSLRLSSGVVEIELEVEEDVTPRDQYRLWVENPRRDARAANRALARVRAELGAAAVACARVRDGHMPEAGFSWEPFDELKVASPVDGHRAPGAGHRPERKGDRGPVPVHGARPNDNVDGAPAGEGLVLAPGSLGNGYVRTPVGNGAATRAAPTTNVNAARSAATPPGRPLIRRLLQRPEPLPPRQHHLRDDGWLIRGDDHGAVCRFVGPFVISGGWWARAVHRDYHFAETQRGDLLWVYYDRRRRRWFLQGHVE
ncbi:MAG: DNA polymerase Y family protein [Acidobacteriota bacterium]|nr:DNA polymerase Y family protein [Acidobacteriota bacterium]